jgi:hypothetical protein
MSWRVRAELKGWLTVAAQQSGLPLSQEIDGRLEQSRDFDQAFGGPRPCAFFRSLAAAMTARYGDEDWLRPELFDAEARDFLIRQLLLADIGRRVGELASPAIRPLRHILARLEDAKEAYLARLADPPAAPPAPRTIRLLHPIRDEAGQLIEELTLVEPTAGDLLAVDKYEGDIAKGAATIAAFAALPVAVVGRLYWQDVLRLTPEIEMLSIPAGEMSDDSSSAAA